MQSGVREFEVSAAAAVQVVDSGEQIQNESNFVCFREVWSVVCGCKVEFAERGGSRFEEVHILFAPSVVLQGSEVVVERPGGSLVEFERPVLDGLFEEEVCVIAHDFELVCVSGVL